MMNDKIKETITTIVDGRKYTVKDVPMRRWDTGIYTTPATVSKIVRGILKANGIRAANYRFKGESFSGGTAFSLYEKDATEETISVRPFIKNLLASMKVGSFNGMIDLYEYSESPKMEIRSTGEIVEYGVKYTNLESEEGYVVA